METKCIYQNKISYLGQAFLCVNSNVRFINGDHAGTCIFIRKGKIVPTVSRNILYNYFEKTIFCNLSDAMQCNEKM